MKKLLLISVVLLFSFTLGACSTIHETMGKLGDYVQENPETAGAAIRLTTHGLLRNQKSLSRANLYSRQSENILAALESFSNDALITPEMIEQWGVSQVQRGNLTPFELEEMRILFSAVRVGLLSGLSSGDIPDNTVLSLRFLFSNVNSAAALYI